MEMVETKSKEIEKLSEFEIENAELKAASLLDNFDNKKDNSFHFHNKSYNSYNSYSNGNLGSNLRRESDNPLINEKVKLSI